MVLIVYRTNPTLIHHDKSLRLLLALQDTSEDSAGPAAAKDQWSSAKLLCKTGAHDTF